MKRLLLTLFAVIMAMAVDAQTDSAKCISQLRDFYTEYNNGNFQNAIDAGERLSGIVDSLKLANSDTLFISLQTTLGKCYFRIKKPLEAAHAVDKASERLRECGRTKELNYAITLDNAGLYYNAVEMCDSALKRSLKALDVMGYVPDKAISQDMYVILLHIAEAYYYTNRFDDAIVYEIRALNIMEKMYGKHSEEYLAELPYLSQYYNGAKEEKKAEEIDDEVDKLKDEYDKGQRDLPDPDQRDLSSAEECHKLNYEAYHCATYYLEHRITSKYASQCFKYLLQWSMASKDIFMVIGDNEAKLLANEKSQPYFAAYLAGCTKYALENNDTTFSQDMFIEAMIDVLNYYSANSEITGKVKYLEKYIDAYNKDKDEFIAMLRKNYPNKK